MALFDLDIYYLFISRLASVAPDLIRARSAACPSKVLLLLFSLSATLMDGNNNNNINFNKSSAALLNREK